MIATRFSRRSRILSLNKKRIWKSGQHHAVRFLLLACFFYFSPRGWQVIFFFTQRNKQGGSRRPLLFPINVSSIAYSALQVTGLSGAQQIWPRFPSARRGARGSCAMFGPPRAFCRSSAAWIFHCFAWTFSSFAVFSVKFSPIFAGFRQKIAKYISFFISLYRLFLMFCNFLKKVFQKVLTFLPPRAIIHHVPRW